MDDSTKENTNITEIKKDPFDLESLRLSQDFEVPGLQKEILSVPVRKPSKEHWVRVHPSEDYYIKTGVLELKEERELYLVAPDLWPELAVESTFGPRGLYTSMNRQGVLFIWPIKLPDPGGRMNPWHQSALDAVGRAKERWVRVVPNMSLGGYELYSSTGDIPEPEWPDLTMQEIIRLAFKDLLIDSLDHPVLKGLRGE
jgi:hypothetical protein